MNVIIDRLHKNFLVHIYETMYSQEKYTILKVKFDWDKLTYEEFPENLLTGILELVVNEHTGIVVTTVKIGDQYFLLELI